ncbi:MAG TPA: hypothetical protein PK014_14480 [Thermoanaerobaculia bacterium]|nr:hypothetical protein [Thermoanaerobaculia bacterium]HUM31246.1 hypothetical protein [Thermoanaerobaculia bacterium]HXK69596.1 hypothetical protein [Thermoanaerobaculia bacterium]
MIRRILAGALFVFFSIVLVAQAPPNACPPNALPDPSQSTNFDIECHRYGAKAESRIHWNPTANPEWSATLYKWLFADDPLCTGFKQDYFSLILYVNDQCTSSGGCEFVDNVGDRTCYQLQYFRDAMACQSRKTDIKCSCPELIPSYEQVYIGMPSPITTVQSSAPPTITPCQITNHSGFTQAGKKWLCTDREVQYINLNSGTEACTPNDLSITHVAWDIAYGTSSLHHISGTSTANFNFQTAEPTDPAVEDNPWYRQCQVGNTDDHIVTATIANSQDASCTTIYSALVDARQIYRTPKVNAALNPDTGVDNGDGTYWGCSQCIHPTFTAGTTNYVDDTEDYCGTYPTYTWRHTLPQGNIVHQPWGKEEADRQYAITSIGTHTLEVQAGLNDPIRFDERVDCFSDPYALQVTIQESPSDPIIDGPVSLCKSDADQPFTLTITNTESYSNQLYDWRSCTDDYQRCFNEYEGPEPCQIKLDTSHPEPWSVTESSTESLTIQPPYPFPDNLKRMQFYVRGIKQYDADVAHTCFGESYYSIHFLDDCQELPPGTWNPDNNPFFPATTAGNQFPLLSEGREATPAMTHTNEAAGEVAWNDPSTLIISGDTTYELAYTLEESETITPLTRFTATLTQYELAPDGTPVEIADGQIDLILSVATPPSNPGDPVVLSAIFTTLSATQHLGITFHLQNTDGVATIHTVTLEEAGTTSNLLTGHDFCDTNDWNFSPDPNYPGTALGCMALAQPNLPTPPTRLTLHNLAAGGIKSDPIPIPGAATQLRISFYTRGESFTSGSYLSESLHILDDTQTEIDQLETWTPYSGSPSWTFHSAPFTPTTGVSYVTIDLVAKHLNGWLALDHITLERFDGTTWIPVPFSGSDFDTFDETSNTLTGWTPYSETGFPATSTFHPVYYDAFSPLTGTDAQLLWGPIQGYGPGYAFSISNQMFGLTSQSFTVDEYVNYELSAWMRGELRHAYAVYDGDLTPRIRICSFGSDGQQRFSTTRTLARTDLSASWRQFRTNITAQEGDTVEITLLSPYLNGWLAFDDIQFGKYNRPPTIRAGDARYIPNQEQDPSIFDGTDLIRDIAISSEVYDPDESGDDLETKITEAECLEGDCDESTGAPSCFYSESSGPSTLLRTPKEDSFLIKPDCRINQESKVSVELTVSDPENPDQLYASDTGSLLLEPFWGLNPGFEKSIDINIPIYWSMDDDPRFPATSTAYQGKRTYSFAGDNAALKGNVATGFAKSFDFTLTDAGTYRLRVYAKGLASIGTGKMGIHLTYAGTTDAVDETANVIPSPDQWEAHDLYFIIPEDVSVSAMVYFGVEDFAGWILYDTSSLYKMDETTGEYTIWVAAYMNENPTEDNADPGFEKTPNEGVTPFWDYRAVEHGEFPATAVEWYYFPATSLPHGVSSNPAGVGDAGATVEYATESGHGLFFTNELDSHLRHNVCYEKSGTLNFSISFDYAYEVLDRSAAHNGSIEFIVTYYPDSGPGKLGTYSFSIPITNTSSGGWLHSTHTLQGIVDGVAKMKYTIDIHHVHGWVGVDNIKIAGFSFNNVGACNLIGPSPEQTLCSLSTANDSFETFYEQNGKEYPCHWLLEVPDYPGTGAFVVKSSENLFFNRSTGEYYDAWHGQHFLAVTNLAKGSVKSKEHEILGGMDYSYDYWYHCKNTDTYGEGGNRLRYFDSAEMTLGEETDPTLFDTNIHVNHGNFSHPSVGEEGKFDFSYYVHLLEGYCSFDDLLLKPTPHKPITPDPLFPTPVISCSNGTLSTERWKEDYQWYLSNQPIAFATTNTVLTRNSGNYSVEFKEDISTVLGFAHPIVVEEAPRIVATSPAIPYCSVISGASNTYSFSVKRPADGTALISCYFNWGDGHSSATLPGPFNTCTATHTYTLQPNQHTIAMSMSAYTENGCSDSVPRQIVIQPNTWPPPSPGYDPPLCFFGSPFPIHNHPFGIGTDDILDLYENGDFATQMMLKSLIVKRTAMGEYLAFNETSMDQFYARRSELEDLEFPEVMVRFEENGIPLSDKDLRMQKYVSDKERDREEYDPANDYEDDYDYYGFTPEYCANQDIVVENEEELASYATEFGYDGSYVYNLDVRFNPSGNVEIHSPCKVKLSGENGRLQIDAQKVRIFGRDGVELIAGVNQSIRSAGKIIIESEFSEIVIPPGLVIDGEELHVESPVDVSIGQNTTLNISGTATILLTGSEKKSEAAIQQNATIHAGELILTSKNEAVVGAAASVNVIGNFHMEAADPSKCYIANSAVITAGSFSGNCFETARSMTATEGDPGLDVAGDEEVAHD